MAAQKETGSVDTSQSYDFLETRFLEGSSDWTYGKKELEAPAHGDPALLWPGRRGRPAGTLGTFLSPGLARDSVASQNFVTVC